MSLSFNYDGDDGVLTLVLDGNVVTLRDGVDEKFDEVRDNLHYGDASIILHILEPDEDEEEEEEEVEEVEVTTFDVENESMGDVAILNNEVWHDGELVPSCVGNKLLSLKQDGLPYGGMVEFIRNLYENTSFRVRGELMNFIEHQGLTVDSDGNLIAYKVVASNYLDKYSSTIDNSVGRVVQMSRAKVDDNHSQHCSKGLHVGGLKYIYWYGNHDDRIVIVKIDPANVVSVPSDAGHDHAKIRVCEYTVIGDYQGELQSTQYDAEDSVEEYYSQDSGCDHSDCEDSEVEFDWNAISDAENALLDEDEFGPDDVTSFMRFEE